MGSESGRHKRAYSLAFYLDDDKEVKPARLDSPDDWALVLKSHTPEVFQIGDTNVKHYRVSTVFLGVDIGGCFFETAIFSNGEIMSIPGRYKTHKEALEGHAKYVRGLKTINGLETPRPLGQG